MPDDKALTKMIVLVLTLIAMLLAIPESRAQTPAQARPMITGAIVETSLATLSGNTRSEANASNDRGRVADNLPLDHMLLQLKRPPEREQALTQLIDQLHDSTSANFHQWLTPNQFGAQFGPAASDIQQVAGWLQAHGFRVNVNYPSGMVIDFSGTAGQVRTAFHTEIHNLQVNGVTHIANMSDPQIPAALVQAVAGVVSLHDFRPHPMLVPKLNYTGGNCSKVFTTCFAVTPPDLATIYNFNPLFNAGFSGQGQTIYLIEATDLYPLNAPTTDWNTFRSTFGLSRFTSGSLSEQQPQPPPNYGDQNCMNPGVISGDSPAEAILDAEYSSAGAPSAAIVIAACASSQTTFGGLFALQNLINGSNPPAIISLSQGNCETNIGATFNETTRVAYQQGVAEGTSIFVSAGDAAGPFCDQTMPVATHGIGVNGLASTPYNVAVGGTDFSDTYSGTTGTYWNLSNTSTGGSAKSYIPEIPWNDSCASQLFATAYLGSTGITYGPSSLCNILLQPQNSTLAAIYFNIVGGSGGPSGCFTGATSPTGSLVVSGTCAGTPKPSWQTGVVGIPNDGVRDLPDVSMFAADGAWSHTYIYCFSDTATGAGGSVCTPNNPSTWSHAGGTSFGAPIMAGVQALVNQFTGAKQGNPNYKYYALAGTEYGASGSSACNSSKGNAVGSSCIFYDVTLGDNDSPCTGSNNCYLDGATVGVLSTSNSSYAPAYKTTTGWDFATGLGTINVNNLVRAWNNPSSAWPKLADSHDFNGDGTSDILFLDTSGDVAVWLINGTTVTSKAFAATGVPPNWSIVGQRDFNGDGKADILWTDTAGDVAIWLMNGTQVVSPTIIGNVPTNWAIVGTGDFNGDGYGDILWRDTAGDVAIWLMNGTQAMSKTIIGTIPTNWTIVGTGDFNGDGNTDILWRDTSGNVAIWLMNGTQVVSQAVVANAPLNWTIVGTGDFNGDGKSDILWRDTGGDVAIWFMNGTTLASGAGVTNVPLNWTIVGTGDYNGDGKSDILWQDAGGDLAVWFMNGATISSAAGLGNVPTVWSPQSANAE
jgi:subtilase family serine protease